MWKQGIFSFQHQNCSLEEPVCAEVIIETQTDWNMGGFKWRNQLLWHCREFFWILLWMVVFHVNCWLHRHWHSKQLLFLLWNKSQKVRSILKAKLASSCFRKSINSSLIARLSGEVFYLGTSDIKYQSNSTLQYSTSPLIGIFQFFSFTLPWTCTAVWTPKHSEPFLMQPCSPSVADWTLEIPTLSLHHAVNWTLEHSDL